MLSFYIFNAFLINAFLFLDSFSYIRDSPIYSYQCSKLHFLWEFETYNWNEKESSGTNAVLSAPKLKAHSEKEYVRRNQARLSSLKEARLLQLHSLGSASNEAEHRLPVGTHRAHVCTTYIQHIWLSTCTAPTQTQAAPAASSCSPLWLSRIEEHYWECESAESWGKFQTDGREFFHKSRRKQIRIYGLGLVLKKEKHVSHWQQLWIEFLFTTALLQSFQHCKCNNVWYHR